MCKSNKTKQCNSHIRFTTTLLVVGTTPGQRTLDFARRHHIRQITPHDLDLKLSNKASPSGSPPRKSSPFTPHHSDGDDHRTEGGPRWSPKKLPPVASLFLSPHSSLFSLPGCFTNPSAKSASTNPSSLLPSSESPSPYGLSSPIAPGAPSMGNYEKPRRREVAGRCRMLT